MTGNHESNGQNGMINDFSACLPNQLPGVIGTYGRQYYVDVPRSAPLVRFVMISPAVPFPDGTWDYTAGSPRYAWTAAAIDSARAEGIGWVVVSMHKPCLSIGRYGCDVGADLLNLLVAKRVDLVLTGHEHLYQRSKQLAHGGGCAGMVPGTFEAACVADADDDLTRGAGTVFATVGTGGVGLRNVFADDPEAGYFTASAGLNRQPSFGYLSVDVSAGQLAARLTAVADGTFTDSFTIKQSPGPPTNQNPVASFSSSSTGLAATFDGSGSADPDGSVVDYAWSFGDGTTGSGATSAHAYASAGTYPVALTVTDDQGATGRVSHDVTVTAVTPTTVAADAFGRSVTGGWGTADAGGPWSTSAASNFSVTGGAAQVRVVAGSGRVATLDQVSARDVDARVDVAFDKPATGSGIYTSLMVRRASSADYRLKVRVTANATMAYLVRTQGGSETKLAGVTVPGVVAQVGAGLKLRLQVDGAGPTMVRGKVWSATEPEPVSWTASATDAFPGLADPGGAGVLTYLSSAASNSPVVATFDNLEVVTPR